MTEYVPTTQDIRNAWWRDQCPANDLDFDDTWGQAFDRWLAGALAEAWDEGFDAGERDVMSHTTWDEPCIPNPYRQEATDE